jgi:4-amino-4-deoxy-L-arabinose transferase-like glycosyltransferase
VISAQRVASAAEAGARNPGASRRISLLTWAVLLSITAVALALRVYRLTGYGIWFDEAYHIALISLPATSDMLGAVLANPPSDPLYVLLLRGWSGMFGTGDASVRALSVLFGTVTVPATYALGCLLAGRSAGLLGAGLIAVSPYAVEFSQEAALYALAALMTTVALALGISWQRTGRGGLAYVLAAAIAIYSHYVVAVVLALFAFGALLPSLRPESRVPPQKYLLATGGATALWLPWLVPTLLSWGTVEVPRSSLPQVLSVSGVLSALGQYAAGTAAMLEGNRPLLTMGLAAGALLMAAGWLLSARPARKHARLLLAVAAVVFGAPALAALVTGRWLFIPHFMLFLLPALSAVAGAAVAWALRERTQSLRGPLIRGVMVAALGVLAVVNVAGSWQFYEHPPHGDDGLREMAAVLRAEARPGEIAFVTPPALSVTLQQYYDGQLVGLPEDFDLRRVYIPYDGTDWRERSIDRVEAFTARSGRFWLVYRPERDEGGGLLEHLTARYVVVRTVPYEFGTLYQFEVP